LGHDVPHSPQCRELVSKLTHSPLQRVGRELPVHTDFGSQEPPSQLPSPEPPAPTTGFPEHPASKATAIVVRVKRDGLLAIDGFLTARDGVSRHLKRQRGAERNERNSPVN